MSENVLDNYGLLLSPSGGSLKKSHVVENVVKPSITGKKKIPDELVRFQVVLTRDTLERLDVVKERVDATTRVEVLRNALRVYDMIVEEISKGNEILIKEKNGDLSKIRLVV